jgi:integrase
MEHANFYFCLDRVFIKGRFHFSEALKVNRNASSASKEKHFNPEPTAIYIATTVRGKFIKEHSGIMVKPKDWDFENKEVKKRKSPEWYEANLYLSNILSEVRKRYLKMKMDNPDVSSMDVKEMMKEVIGGKDHSRKEMDFFEVYKLFLEEKKKISKPKTYSKYEVLERLLREFAKKNYPLNFSRINKQFEADFKYYSYTERKHLNNTVSRGIKCIKVFMKWAMEHPSKFHSNNLYERFTSQQDDSNPMALTMEEFHRICELDLSDNDKLDRVRDVFVLQCLTGQRYSDICNFRMKDLREKGEDMEWNLYQVKNNKKEVVEIPLLPKAVEIVNKYKAGRAFVEDEPILPIISIDKMNNYLKEVGKLAELNTLENRVNYRGVTRVEKSSKKWELLSTHCARRTFITICLELGMRAEVVRAITGQKSDKIMLQYVSIKTDVKKKELAKVWEQKI